MPEPLTLMFGLWPADLVQLCWFIQKTPYYFCHFCPGIGFEENSIDPHFLYPLPANFFTVAGTEQDRDIRLDLFQFLAEDIAGHLRHGHVGDDQVECFWFCPEQIQRVPAACPGGNAVAQPFQYLRAHLGDFFFIVNKEDVFPTSRERLFLHCIGRFLLPGYRQVDCKHGAFSRLACHRHPAAPVFR